MRHYEIVFLVHPDQGGQVPAMIERYQNMVSSKGGTVHRVENWGRRLLSYPINKAYKANYILINIECDTETLNQLTDSFRFNDAVIRELVICRNKAITTPSLLAKAAADDANAAMAQSEEQKTPQAAGTKVGEAEEAVTPDSTTEEAVTEVIDEKQAGEPK